MEEIIKYVMETPENTNPNILRDYFKGMGFDESNIEEAIGLVMNNLVSLNWNILREGLESLKGSGDSEKTRRVLFEGELTTDGAGSTYPIAILPAIDNIPLDKSFIIVIINTIEYKLPKLIDDSSTGMHMLAYGEGNSSPHNMTVDFSTYPCAITFYEAPIENWTDMSSGVFLTENPGTYNVKIEVEE